MAITSLDGIIAGCKPPSDIYKIGTTTMGAGTFFSYLYAAGMPGAATVPATGPGVGGQVISSQQTFTITNGSQANPSVITINGCITTGTQVTISGTTGTTPSINNTYVATAASATTFTIPVNVTAGGGANSGTVTVNSWAGQMLFPTPSANTYLARFSVSSTQVQDLFLCDRIWSNSGLSVTSLSAQPITTPTWPARDANGATTGVGVMVGLEVTSLLGSITGTIYHSISYTGTVNGASQTASTSQAVITASKLGTFYPFSLAAGDTGVTSIQSFTNAVTNTSGSFALVAYRVIAKVSVQASCGGACVDAVSGGFPRCYDGTVPWIVAMPSATASACILGHAIFTQG